MLSVRHQQENHSQGHIYVGRRSCGMKQAFVKKVLHTFKTSWYRIFLEKLIITQISLLLWTAEFKYLALTSSLLHPTELW